MFFSKFLKVATITLLFSNPFLLESLGSHRFSFVESAAQAQTVFTSSSQAKQWQTMTSKEANFTVLMPPGNPQQETLENSEGQYQFQIQRYILSDENGISYLVAYTNELSFVAKSVTSEQAEIFYNNFAEGLLINDPGAKIIYQRPITLKGVVGQEIEIETSEGSLLQARVFLTNSRLYVLLVGMPTPSLAKSSNVAQFLNSFNWVNNQAPVVSQKSTSKKPTPVDYIDKSMQLK
ncbi:hypothetical protein ACL6C3_14260 [Capilliphycus salinus ALCB114379]|uniref:hypothetical protein n=1 Tax=Capilliphycus salinus TaxID=2768948 RepID=UPI0039A5285B